MNPVAPLILPPLSALYGVITRTRLSMYQRGTFHTTKLTQPVISVGNITTGGTGKTPLVEWLARMLANHGRKVAVLTRGYGRERAHERVLVSDGQVVFSTAEQAGDEAFLEATNLKGLAAVISDANRIAAAQDAVTGIATWDGARLVLRTIHGLNNVREVWVLDGNVLKLQRAAQTPGGADSATRDLTYNKGS